MSRSAKVLLGLVIAAVLIWAVVWYVSRPPDPDLLPWPCAVESAHPYPAGTVISYTHWAPQNVVQMGIHWSRIRLGEGDLLEVIGLDGVVRNAYSGPFEKDDFLSEVVWGRSILLRLTSQSGGWGYCIAQWRYWQVSEPTPTCPPTQTPAPTFTPAPTYTPQVCPTIAPTATPTPEPTPTPTPEPAPLCHPCEIGKPEPEGYFCRRCSGMGNVYLRLKSPNADCQWCKVEWEGWATYYHDKFVGQVRRDGSVYNADDDGCAVRGDLYAQLAGVRLAVCRPGHCVMCVVRDSGDTELWKAGNVVVDMAPWLWEKLGEPLDKGIVWVKVEVAR